MIELPNGKVARTQAEQVGFNSKKIEEIIKFLNESGLKDLVINLEAASGVLTDDQYAIAELSPSYIVLNGKVYYKGYEDGTNIDFFEAVPKAAAATSLFLQVARIRIVEATKNYALSSVNIFESYDKSQIDSIVSSLNSAIDAKAALSGANFTGAITAPSIIENMSGYSFSNLSVTGLTVNTVYAGAVKTGNKLTIVWFGKLTKTSAYTGADYATFARFVLPEAILAKIFPTDLGGGGTCVAFGNASLFYDNTITKMDKLYNINKGGTTTLNILITGLDSMTQDKVYYCRIEQTFLLSDSLAS